MIIGDGKNKILDKHEENIKMLAKPWQIHSIDVIIKTVQRKEGCYNEEFSKKY